MQLSIRRIKNLLPVAVRLPRKKHHPKILIGLLKIIGAILYSISKFTETKMFASSI